MFELSGFYRQKAVTGTSLPQDVCGIALSYFCLRQWLLGALNIFSFSEGSGLQGFSSGLEF